MGPAHPGGNELASDCGKPWSVGRTPRGMLPAMNVPRRFRSFSLRTLMVLVGVVCLLAAWIGRDWQTVRARNAFRARLEEMGGWTKSDSSFVFPPENPTVLPWTRRLFGDRPANDLIFTREPTPDELETVARLFPEAVPSVFTGGVMRLAVPPHAPSP